MIETEALKLIEDFKDEFSKEGLEQFAVVSQKLSYDEDLKYDELVFLDHMVGGCLVRIERAYEYKSKLLEEASAQLGLFVKNEIGE
jgi:hypothetical protein